MSDPTNPTEKGPEQEYQPATFLLWFFLAAGMNSEIIQPMKGCKKYVIMLKIVNVGNWSHPPSILFVGVSEEPFYQENITNLFLIFFQVDSFRVVFF